MKALTMFSLSEDPRIASHYAVLMCLRFGIFTFNQQLSGSEARPESIISTNNKVKFNIILENDLYKIVLMVINLDLHKILRLKFKSATSLHQIRMKILL